jgi:hypothetical protein
VEPFVVDQAHFEVEESTSNHLFYPVESHGTSEILAVEIRQLPDQVVVEDFSTSGAEKVERLIGRFDGVVAS